MVKGFRRKFQPLEILSKEQVERIHQGTLDVLWKTGIKLESEKHVDFFAENGCKVDDRDNRVRFPGELVEECLSRCPGSFRLRARDPNNDLIIDGERVYFAPFAGMDTVDLETWEPRQATREEYYDYVTVLDALENVHLLNSYPYFGFQGVAPEMAVLEGNAAKIRNSAKFQIAPNTRGAQIFNLEMAKAVDSEIMQVLEVASPLMFSDAQIESAFLYSKNDVPTRLASGLISGATGPATIAGSLVSNNAETIASLVMLQLMKPGTRVIARNCVFPQNMRTGAPQFGSVSISLFQVAFGQVWRKYRIPTEAIAVGPSSSKKADFQAGYEKMCGGLSAALSGANVVYFLGGIHGELSAHPIQAILDNDVVGMIGRFLEGVDVSEETLAIDLIQEVGPIPGHFLGKAHTRKWWKTEQYLPRAADDMTYPEWLESGKKDCIDYARERMEEILSSHKVSLPLSVQQEQEIEGILRQAREYYAKMD